MNNKLQKIIAIVGPTAVGKTLSSLKLLDRYDMEIINADSMQVYKYLDIGTDKPTLEIRRRYPHHLLDVVSLDEEFTAKNFQTLADSTIKKITEQNKIPLIVGGCGFYLKSLLYGLFELAEDLQKSEIRASLNKKSKEELWQTLLEVDFDMTKLLHQNDRYRIERALEVYYLTHKKMSDMQKEHGFPMLRYDCLLIGLNDDRENIYKRINERVDKMISIGLIDEVKSIIKMGYDETLKPLQTFSYCYYVQYVKNDISLVDATEETKKATRNFAKRQLTWFRKDKKINWFNKDDEFDKILFLINSFLEN